LYVKVFSPDMFYRKFRDYQSDICWW